MGSVIKWNVDDTRARTLLAEGRTVDAERVARSAVKSLERGGEQAVLAEALNTHGIALARMGRHSRARALLVEDNAQYGLPYFVREYAADATTPLRTKYSDYNLAPEYLERRIIGLVDTIHVFDHVSGAHVSKVSFSYDWDNQSNTYLIDQGGATQHDNVNYGASFRAGRGNLCAVRRWNVNAINDWNQGQWTSFTVYNTNGSVIFTADALGNAIQLR